MSSARPNNITVYDVACVNAARYFADHLNRNGVDRLGSMILKHDQTNIVLSCGDSSRSYAGNSQQTVKLRGISCTFCLNRTDKSRFVRSWSF